MLEHVHEVPGSILRTCIKKKKERKENLKFDVILNLISMRKNLVSGEDTIPVSSKLDYIFPKTIQRKHYQQSVSFNRALIFAVCTFTVRVIVLIKNS